MKKTFLLFVACLMASVVSGQAPYVIFDGEDETNRNPWWGVDANVEVVDWLQKDGTNTANPNFGATIWRSNENPGYAGGGITLDLDISAYNKISVDISKRVSGNAQVELQNGETKVWLNVYYDASGSGGYGTGTWQTLVFDIPEGWTRLTALLVAPHNENTGENPINFDEDNERHRMSWDNVTAFYQVPTGIDGIKPGDFVVATTYYTIYGQEVRKPALTGIYLVKETYYSKKITVTKRLIPAND